MFENLQERIERSFKILKGEGKITEINVSNTLKDVRKALVEADVHHKTAKDFINRVKQKALGQNVLTAVKPQELMFKIVYDELTELMGSKVEEINTSGNPTVILMSGLQGSGKTTFSGKLAKMYKEQKGRRPLLVACDVYRPAAIQQLQTLGETVGVPVYTEEGNNNPVEIATNAIRFAKDSHYDMVIVDTAGRLAVDNDMMDEIANIREAINPQETLFVVDSMTGQDAVNTAREFNNRIDFDGVILTKLDGDTRGGAALSIRAVVEKPIKYVGTGEKMEDLMKFDPNGMASRILGMGDIGSLVDRINQIYKEEDAKKMEEKILKNKFDFEDFKEQILNIQKMGSLKNIASMIPGMGKALKDVEVNDDAFKGILAIIDSMTPAERQKPEILSSSRRQRISRGSGRSIQEVNNLIKQFDTTRKMMRQVAKGSKNPKNLVRQISAAKKAFPGGRMPF